MTFHALLQGFFTDRLLRQRRASGHTIAAYRDTFRLLLRFAAEHRHKPPSQLAIEDLDAPFLSEFLDHIERTRGNCARTRNARLAALHAFFLYVLFTDPRLTLHCQRVLAIPSKRFERKPVEFLQPEEIEALLASPNTATRIGRRDRTLLLLALQTGLRVSELIGLRRHDVVLGTGAHVRCQGKGRKTRCTPLRQDVSRVLQSWLGQPPTAPDPQPVFPSSRGETLSRDAIERIVHRHIQRAQKTCPSLQGRNITPHTLRHTAAMELLRAGVDRSVIALWLGHESVETTQIYFHADMRLKEEALARTRDSGLTPTKFEPSDDLLAFLEGL